MRSLITIVITTFCTQVSATISHYQCNEPQKINGKIVTVDWSKRLVSYDVRSFVKAYEWTPKAIFWFQERSEHTGSFKTPKVTISLRFNLVDNTLMYTVLDSHTTLPANANDWAKFLPIYLQCREFF